MFITQEVFSKMRPTTMQLLIVEAASITTHQEIQTIFGITFSSPLARLTMEEYYLHPIRSWIPAATAIPYSSHLLWQ